ncbi:MAG: DUF3810 domain-containing protein [Saprospiraceae bacterium]|nr:DUF3810 domain-containing protein [Saprospiraceae bacterium]
MNRTQKTWIALGVIALVLRWAAGHSPELVERYYSRGLFPVIRNVIDYGAAWLPAPLAFLLIPLLLFLGALNAMRWFKRKAPLVQKLKSAGFSLLAFAGAVTFLFLFLWGFNYSRVPLETQLGLTAQPLTMEQIREELDYSTRAVIAARKRIPGAGNAPLTSAALPNEMELLLRGEVSNQLTSWAYPAPGRVRGRVLYPKGILLRFGTAGIYFPFTGEGHADAGLHPLQLPAVVAHEMAHAYGFGDEGVCNFIAYAACVQSNDPMVAYSAELTYWRTLAVNYRAYQPDAYRDIRDGLPAGIRADLDAINQNILAYPDIFPRFRDAAYNTYLRAQGIREGMLNYDRVMMLARAYRLDSKWGVKPDPVDN